MSFSSCSRVNSTKSAIEKLPPAEIVRSRRRTVALIVTSDARLIVRAPLRAPLHYIENFINEKSSWIRRKFLEASTRPAAKERTFCEGERFLFLGKEYPLKKDEKLGAPALVGEELRVPEGHPTVIRSSLVRWYKARALEILEGRARFYSDLARLEFRSLRISDAKTRWGSCGFKGSLNLSWRLIMAPLEVIDYVVAHEMAHLKEKNHAPCFWREVETLVPRYREPRAWLRANGHLLALGSDPRV